MRNRTNIIKSAAALIIASLTILSPRDRFLHHHFSELGRDLGGDLHFVQVTADGPDHARSAWVRLRALLDEANGFFIHDDTILLVNEYAGHLHARPFRSP